MPPWACPCATPYIPDLSRNLHLDALLCTSRRSRTPSHLTKPTCSSVARCSPSTIASTGSWAASITDCSLCNPMESSHCFIGVSGPNGGEIAGSLHFVLAAKAREKRASMFLVASLALPLRKLSLSSRFACLPSSLFFFFISYVQLDRWFRNPVENALRICTTERYLISVKFSKFTIERQLNPNSGMYNRETVVVRKFLKFTIETAKQTVCTTHKQIFLRETNLLLWHVLLLIDYLFFY